MQQSENIETLEQNPTKVAYTNSKSPSYTKHLIFLFRLHL